MFNPALAPQNQNGAANASATPNCAPIFNARTAGRVACPDKTGVELEIAPIEHGVLWRGDVDERRLHSGQDVVDDALVDVADDRPGPAALDVELADPPLVVPAIAVVVLGGTRTGRALGF